VRTWFAPTPSASAKRVCIKLIRRRSRRWKPRWRTDQRLTAQLASRDADLKQAETMLRSSELTAEAERRTKAVLESQDMQLRADLHAKQANLAAAMVNLGYTKIYAPSEGTVGERQVRTGQLVSPGMQVIAFVDVTKWGAGELS